MRTRTLGGALAVMLALLWTGAARAADAGGKEVRVFAAASLTDALTEVARRFEAKEGAKVTLAFGASSDLVRQLKAGAAADVFVSADEQKMDALQEAGLVTASERVALLGNQLVVVTPVDEAVAVKAPKDLAKVKRLALADPEAVPAGVYARRWLEGLGLWEAVKPKVVPALDVRAALAAVETGACQAGIVYRTDAALSKKTRVAYEVPPEQGPRIVYPAAPLAKAKSPLARRFVAFLQGDEARALFERYGFRFLPARK